MGYGTTGDAGDWASAAYGQISARMLNSGMTEIRASEAVIRIGILL